MHFQAVYYLSEQVPCRWILKRIKRYSHISCEFSDAVLERRDNPDEKSPDSVAPALLPAVLSTCKSSAVLSFSVKAHQGRASLLPAISIVRDKYITQCRMTLPSDHPSCCAGNQSTSSRLVLYMSSSTPARSRCVSDAVCFTGALLISSGAIIIGEGIEHASFATSLNQHLTELDLHMYPWDGATQILGSLGMLTALQKLKLDCESCQVGWSTTSLRLDLLGKSLPLKFLHLISLQIDRLEHGELALSCPKLAEAEFAWTSNLCIRVEDAALTRLTLYQCNKIEFAMTTPMNHLQGLKSLSVTGCNGIDRHLIEDIGHMDQLQCLSYMRLPALRIPTNFPKTLREISLSLVDWVCDLPRGLRELHELKVLRIRTNCIPLELTQPWPEQLPMDNLDYLWLDSKVYKRQCKGGSCKGSLEQVQ